MSVRMFKPKTLAETYSLARLQAITVAALKDQPKPFTRTPNSSHTNRTFGVVSNPPQSTTKPTHQGGLLPTPNTPKLPSIPSTQSSKTITNREFDEKGQRESVFGVIRSITQGTNAEKNRLMFCSYKQKLEMKRKMRRMGREMH